MRLSTRAPHRTTASAALVIGLAAALGFQKSDSSKQPPTRSDPAIAGALPTGVLHSELHDLRIELLIDSLDHPVSLAFLPDGRGLITERFGGVRLIDQFGKLVTEPVKNVPQCARDSAGSTGGFTDVLLHPDYRENGWIYLSYDCESLLDSPMTHRAALTIARGRIQNGQWAEQSVLWRSNLNLDIRGGGNMVFDSLGNIYFSSGPDITQAKGGRTSGLVHRMNDDGHIPSDNPFVNLSSATKSVWSNGSGTIEGLAFYVRNGDLWAAERAANGAEDDLDIIRKAESDSSSTPRAPKPGYRWSPSIGVSGLAFYTGRAFAKWQGNLFVSSTGTRELIRIEVTGDSVTHQESLFKDLGQVRNVLNGPDGNLYVLLGDSIARRHDRLIRLVHVRRSDESITFAEIWTKYLKWIFGGILLVMFLNELRTVGRKEKKAT